MFTGRVAPGAVAPWKPVAFAMFAVAWGANQFVSMLVAYRLHSNVGTAVGDGLFGVYALGLVPALLIGGPSADRWGRAALVRPSAVLSVIATVVLMFGAHSAPILFAGRFLAGIASGAIFAAGTAWVKELSEPNAGARRSALPTAGARRSAVALSAGFGLGPVATGALAQWGPDPLVVAYLPHLVLMLGALPWLWTVPETVTRRTSRGRFSHQLRAPAARHPRFVAVVAPPAPWVFGAPAIAFAVLPSLVATHTYGRGIAFAGLTAGVTLGVGVCVQRVGRRLDRTDDLRGALLGLVAVTAGLLVAALAAHLANPLVALAAACLLGAGYGLGLVCGLQEATRLAGPDELAGLTAVFYALTYLGFALPVILAALHGAASYPTMLLILAALAGASLLLLLRQSGRAAAPTRSAIESASRAADSRSGGADHARSNTMIDTPTKTPTENTTDIPAETAAAAPRVLVVWDEALTSYDLGPAHPLQPVRLELTIALARGLGILDRPGVMVAAPIPADDAVLALVHDRDYIAAVRAAPDQLLDSLATRWGLGTGDNPIFPAMHEASALATGATVQAAKAVWEGTHQHAINIAGGLHHAMADRASGFCVYDDPAVAIAWLLAHGAERVAYVDIDVHHGDGVQAAFYDDPRVLTVSLHESGRYLFPGTGFADEIGTGDGRGRSVNVALNPGAGDAQFIAAFDAVVPAVLRAFRPQLLLTQLGCDTHHLDPLAHLELTLAGQQHAHRRLHELAVELCGGRWVATGGGGYALVDVVPRAWTHALAEMTGAPVNGAVPASWRELAAERTGRRGPELLTDDARPGSDRGLTESLNATRDAVFDVLGAR